MTFDGETFYRLLPAIYRLRDGEQGDPLKALLQVIAREVGVLEADLAQLYDDQFIETCAEWVVPYIGDLIGDRPIYTDLPNFPAARAAVANTISYRRRKGTAAVLEQLARDVTDWPARAVEFFQRLGTTQYMNHVRPQPLATVNLRQWRSLEYVGTPFESTAHTAEMRRIGSRRGRYNIPNIGLFLWRLNAYSIVSPSRARAVVEPADGRYRFHPVGLDAPLFNHPQKETEFTQFADPINVPEPLNRRVLYEELDAWRQAVADGQTPVKTYFQNEGSRMPVFEILTDNSDIPIPPEQILICDLSNWRRPLPTLTYQSQLATANSVSQSVPIQIAVDPVLGRITFPAGVTPQAVKVRYSYGFSGDVGGGSYDRSESVLPFLKRAIVWQLGVKADADPNDPQIVADLTTAINQWNSQPAGTTGIIAILDSDTYAETFPTIQIPENSQLLIVAADWPAIPGVAPSNLQRIEGHLSPTALRPHLIGNLSIGGTTSTSSDRPGILMLNGLLLEGTLTVQAGNLAQVSIHHCTLVPDQGGLTVAADNPQLTLQLDHSLCGPIEIAPDVTIAQLQIETSLIDAGGGTAIDAANIPTDVKTSTVIGSTKVQSLEASNAIFTATVVAEQRQEGCVRFSSLPLDSKVPRPYRCQPHLALLDFAKFLNKSSVDELSPSEQAITQNRVVPLFTSLSYGDPGYGQLSHRCASEIHQGADDEAEMGGFHNLYQPQRETNLRLRLHEYLPFRLETGIFFVT